MGKRKTKAQKKIADLRHQLTQQKTALPTSPEEKTTEKKPERFSYTISPTTTAVYKSSIHDTYTYVRHDLLKTAMISVSIVMFQFVLFLLLRLHILQIPSVSY